MLFAVVVINPVDVIVPVTPKLLPSKVKFDSPFKFVFAAPEVTILLSP